MSELVGQGGKFAGSFLFGIGVGGGAYQVNPNRPELGTVYAVPLKAAARDPQSGRNFLGEAKNGPSASLNTNQRAAHREISDSGFTPYGDNAANAGFNPGQHYPAQAVDVRYYDIPPVP